MTALPIDDLPADQSLNDSQLIVVGGQPMQDDDDLPADQRSSDTQYPCVGGQPLRPDQSIVDTHDSDVGVDPSCPPTTAGPTPKVAASAGEFSDPTISGTSPIEAASGQTSYGILAAIADIFDDIEDTRIGNENRVRALEQLAGVTNLTLLAAVDNLRQIEHDLELGLKRAIRKHPLGPWIKRTPGIGEKQGARLIAAIGDPYWNSLHDRPRTVSELWAYCGYNVIHPDQRGPDTQGSGVGVDPSSDTGQKLTDTHVEAAGVAPTRRKGHKANWSNNAKMRAYLCAESAVKTGVRRLHEPDDSNGYDADARKATTPYGQTYLDGRVKYADAMHQQPCKRCGPSGKPALAGSPLSEGHKYARALRLVAKAILKDLWREARDLAS